MSRSRLQSGRTVVIESASSPIGPPDQVAILNPSRGGTLKLISTPDNQVTIRQVGINVDVQFSSSVDQVVTITSITNRPGGGYNVSGNGPPGLAITLRGRTLTIPSTGQFNLVGVTLPLGLTQITSPSGNVSGTIYMKARVPLNPLAYIEDVLLRVDGMFNVEGMYTLHEFENIYINGQLSVTGNFGNISGKFHLDNGVNYIKDNDGNNIGLFNIYQDQLVTVITINPSNGQYILTGIIPPDYTPAYINGQSFGITNVDYNGFEVKTTLNQGTNDIVYNGVTIGIFNIDDGKLVPWMVSSDSSTE